MPEYKLREGSMHERFFNSRTKVQLIGGGFANGKTAAMCVRAFQLSQEYPGFNALMARSTYPKLNDTLRKEFLKWVPKRRIKSFPMSQNGSNSCLLENGSVFNFRYVQQGGRSSGEATTSNLLSATYDLACVDQIEDPEITRKDFDDILGRMRGNTPYIGNDPTMPRTGPRFVFLSCNPTRNWVYSTLVRPLKMYEATGIIQDDLYCARDPFTREPLLNAEGKPQLLLELFEGSTYENASNLGADFIQSLESAYQGQMRDRFLLGEWASYEGLVYPAYSPLVHGVAREHALNYLDALRKTHHRIEWIDGYDFGIAQQSCYMLAFVDPFGNVIIIDGFYQKELLLETQKKLIIAMRAKYGAPLDQMLLADPDIFRRKGATLKTVGKSISDLMLEMPNSIICARGNNDILNGVVKVSNYIAIKENHRNPFTGDFGAPHLYVALELRWFEDEITAYNWQQNTDGSRADKPVDRKDHAMDTLKYMMTYQPELSRLIDPSPDDLPPWAKWQEMDSVENRKAHRYG